MGCCNSPHATAKSKGHPMKISKKYAFIAAFLAITFFSFNLNSNTSYKANFNVTETTLETLKPHGVREVKVQKDYSISFFGNSSKDLKMMKEGKPKKK